MTESLLVLFCPPWAIGTVQARFADPRWRDFYLLADRFHEILQALIDARPSLAVQEVAVSQIRTMITAIFITIVVLCNLFYYPAIITSLNKSIKCSRALLLLLPEDVIRGVKVLHETMLTLSKNLMVA